MSFIPPPVLPILQGQNLTDKGCIPLSNTLAQSTQPKNLDAVLPGMFEGCNATNAANSTIKVNPAKGWVSLNFISTASLQEMVGELSRPFKLYHLLIELVSIDDHPLWVYAIDGRYVKPQLVDVSNRPAY